MATLSESATQQLADFIEVETRNWIQQYIEQRKAVLARRKILATGGLQDSFAFALTKNITGAVTNSLELAFDDYGRYIEMQRLNVPRGGSEFIDALAAWIVRKGLEGAMTRDFMAKRNLRTAPQNVLTQLAWSVAVKRRQVYRRRSWYVKSKSAAVTELYNRVADRLPEIVVQELKKAFNTF